MLPGPVHRSSSRPLGGPGSIAHLTALLILLACSLLPVSTWAQEENTLQVFVRAGCPHCSDARAWLPVFNRDHPDLHIVYRVLDDEVTAREDLIRISEQAGIWPPGVPTFVYRDRVLVGFDSPATTGPALAALVASDETQTGTVDAGWLGTLDVTELGLPLFTLAIGLLDGFNPCAMWVLLFLLSMLVHLQDRRRMALVAGTFVAASGAVYYVFLAAWFNLFLVLDFSLALRLFLALVALAIGYVNVRDCLAPRNGFTLSIPDAAKPHLYSRIRRIINAGNLVNSLWAVTTLAVVVNLVELLCTAGLPALYTAILSEQNLAPSAHYGYLALYIVGYILDDSLMVTAAVIALSNRRLTERAGRLLKLVSGSAMLMLGAILILKPDWLL